MFSKFLFYFASFVVSPLIVVSCVLTCCPSSCHLMSIYCLCHPLVIVTSYRHACVLTSVLQWLVFEHVKQPAIFIHSFHFTILSSAFGSATCLLYSTTWYTWYLTAVNTFNEVSLRAQYNQIHQKVYFVKHGTHYSLKRTIKKCTL